MISVASDECSKRDVNKLQREQKREDPGTAHRGQKLISSWKDKSLPAKMEKARGEYYSSNETGRSTPQGLYGYGFIPLLSTFGGKLGEDEFRPCTQRSSFLLTRPIGPMLYSFMSSLIH